MDLKRWITGLVAVPILILLIGFAPRWMFYAVVWLVSLGGLMEFYRLTSPNLSRLISWSTAAFTSVLFFLLGIREFYLALGFVPFLLMVTMILFMFFHRSTAAENTGLLAKALLGPVYITLPLSLFLLIDRFPGGKWWVFFLLSVIFSSDMGAFYFGRLFGSHKLFRRISPGKTWEGAVGGLFSSVFVAALFAKLFPLGQHISCMLFLGAGISIAGQLGDLCESMIKRNHGEKDSGRILPGHGGMLDRIDGLLFGIPVLYGYLSFAVFVR
ncbi:MAG TPA: phosphatidate cytidylyltransferase [Desulfobacteraceae bacterium]|nr:MAG: phosphatidate cytidylyltransferase [Deltaproteobacteria bacterium]HDZ24513.1 phosphatidate cytidylyltransferase [Desulfobacteraceae bacterium]